MKRMIAVMIVPALGVWLFAVGAAAQGRGQTGRPGGAGMPGAQAPMGMPGSEAGKAQRPATSPAATHEASPMGPKSPTTLLEQNTQLTKNLAKFFPDGTDLLAQANGFKNLGEFVSAVHVSQNLSIPFDQLKCTQLGTTKATGSGAVCPATVTNADGMSLGKAIQRIKPDVDSGQAVRQAEREAKREIETGKT
jgi:hypothetical protein